MKRLDKDLVDGKPPIIALQEQQELLLLPTIRIFNLFTSNVSAKLFALAPGSSYIKTFYCCYNDSSCKKC